MAHGDDGARMSETALEQPGEMPSRRNRGVINVLSSGVVGSA
jgi:hypothetical protein